MDSPLHRNSNVVYNSLVRSWGTKSKYLLTYYHRKQIYRAMNETDSEREMRERAELKIKYQCRVIE